MSFEGAHFGIWKGNKQRHQWRSLSTQNVDQPQPRMDKSSLCNHLLSYGYRSTLNLQTADFSPCFHLSGFLFGAPGPRAAASPGTSRGPGSECPRWPPRPLFFVAFSFSSFFLCCFFFGCFFFFPDRKSEERKASSSGVGALGCRGFGSEVIEIYGSGNAKGSMVEVPTPLVRTFPPVSLESPRCKLILRHSLGLCTRIFTPQKQGSPFGASPLRNPMQDLEGRLHSERPTRIWPWDPIWMMTILR